VLEKQYREPLAEPFLNWLVDIMLESSPSRRPIFATILRGANPAQTPGYYRTVSVPVSHLLGGVNLVYGSSRNRRAVEEKATGYRNTPAT
jgi:hypothetical protein